MLKFDSSDGAHDGEELLKAFETNGAKANFSKGTVDGAKKLRSFRNLMRHSNYLYENSSTFQSWEASKNKLVRIGRDFFL